jgi:hypothetical protein
VRGVAPPRTPVNKRMTRGAVAANGVLYTPPGRRAN